MRHDCRDRQTLAKEFTSDENLTEVLMLMTKAYLKAVPNRTPITFDILVSEHPDNIFTKAILLYADHLLPKRRKKKR